MEKIPTTRIMLEGLHQCVGIKKEGTSNSTTDKEEVAHLFGHVFKGLPKLIREKHCLLNETEVVKLEKIILSARSQREMVYLLTSATKDILQPTCEQYLATLEYAPIPGDLRRKFTALKTAMKKRLEKIRPNIVSNEQSEEMKELDLLLQILSGGIINICHVSWSYFNVLPGVLERDGEDVNLANCKRVAASVQRIILNLLTCHDDVFLAVNDFMRRENSKQEENNVNLPPFYWPLYHAEDFRIEDGKLELSAAVIREAEEYLIDDLTKGKIRLEEPRVGCAGLVTIPSIHQWCLKAAKRCLFPHIDHVQSLPVETKDSPNQTNVTPTGKS